MFKATYTFCNLANTFVPKQHTTAWLSTMPTYTPLQVTQVSESEREIKEWGNKQSLRVRGGKGAM